MTLKELWMVVARQWKMVVAITMVCVLACGAYLLVAKKESSCTATARIVVNSQIAGVAGLASSAGRQLPDSFASVSVSVKTSTDIGTVSVTATGIDADTCIEAANTVAEAANEAARQEYSGFENAYSGVVEPAMSTEEPRSSSVKYLLVALLGGLFISICGAVVLDVIKRPVKTPDGVQDLTDLPVLEILPTANGERLLANVRFASKRSGLQSVIVVPAGDKVVAEKACDLLNEAATIEGSDLEAAAMPPLSEGMTGAYSAQKAEATVVTVRQWADTLGQLESTVAELKLAGANLVGIAFSRE